MVLNASSPRHVLREHVYAYCKTGDWTLVAPDVNRQFALPPHVLAVIGALAKPGHLSEHVDQLVAMTGASVDDCSQLVERMLELGLLVDSDSPLAVPLPNIVGWGGDQARAATRYWLETRDYPFISYDSDAAQSVETQVRRAHEAGDDPTPPPMVRHDGAPFCVLPRPRTLHQRSLSTALEGTTTARNGLTREHLGEIASFTFGMTHEIGFEDGGPFILKCVPSGGARHPAELFVLGDGSLLPEAVFHYSVRDHALYRVGEVLPEARGICDRVSARMLFVVAAFVHRNMWRYRQPRAFQVVLNDMGHIRANLEVCAASLGVDVFEPPVDTARWEQWLGLSPLVEPVMFSVALR